MSYRKFCSTLPATGAATGGTEPRLSGSGRRELSAILAALLSFAAARAEQIPIAVARGASETERTAAAELAEHLSRLYPGDRFDLVSAKPASGRAILIGTPASFPDVLQFVAKEKLRTPESFAVAGTATTAVIAGADASGALYGVYALLEKLGWGFYLSYDAAPPPRKEPLRFTDWNLADAPVFADRVIFQWHNFLSSASTWEFEDWQRWIRGAARMRYNTVMIHAYGNNPMFTFQHNGQMKPVGYLATTQKGRDWGTQHVNDVRRMVGGDAFRGPVFGSSAAIVPEEERAPAAQAMVRKAFAFARTFGLHVTFALDVDTESANPQNIILTLPASARFPSGKLQLPNPDTPEGYAYWKAQVAQLLATYPQIDRLVVWFRASNTPWRNVKPDEFPAAWKTQFAAALGKNSSLRDDKNAPSMFAIARITSAFGKALQQLGRNDVELGSGTWHSTHLPAADAFFDPRVKLYWLDWSTTFDKPKIQAALRSIRPERPMLPVVWAHHDDRTFVGRPYMPFPSFTALVKGTGTGYGVIHWTTRPLDIYFKSLAEQVWEGTRDRPLRETARDLAARSFGPTTAVTGSEYFVKWLTEGRMFGRETTNRFIDVPLKDAADVIARCRDRLALLGRIDEEALPPEGRERLRYYRDYEEFTAEFFRHNAAFERAQELYKNGEIQAARHAITACDARNAIELYRRAASHGHMTRGEQALIVSLNLRWLPYVISLRQALAVEEVRYKFGPTQHEPLAQGAGANTFWIDERHSYWKVLGEKESGAPAVTDAGAPDELCRSGIRVEQPLTLKLAGAMGDRLTPGRYRVSLKLKDRAAQESVIAAAGGAVELSIRPANGPVVACGVTLALERR